MPAELGKPCETEGIRGFHAFASRPVHKLFHSFGGSPHHRGQRSSPVTASDQPA